MNWSGQIDFGGDKKITFHVQKLLVQCKDFLEKPRIVDLQKDGALLDLVESAIPNTPIEGTLTFQLAGTYTQITQHTVARRLTSKKLNERFWERL